MKQDSLQSAKCEMSHRFSKEILLEHINAAFTAAPLIISVFATFAAFTTAPFITTAVTTVLLFLLIVNFSTATIFTLHTVYENVAYDFKFQRMAVEVIEIPSKLFTKAKLGWSKAWKATLKTATSTSFSLQSFI